MERERLFRPPRGVANVHERYRECGSVETREEADALLDTLAHDYARREKISVAEARVIEQENIGYWAGAYLSGTIPLMLRVFRLFHTRSPVFGTEVPSLQEIWWSAIRVATERGEPMTPEEIAEMMFWTHNVYRWRETKT